MAPIFCSQCRQVHEYVLSYEKSGLLPDLLDDWCPAISAIKSGRLEFAVQISMLICSDLRAVNRVGTLTRISKGTAGSERSTLGEVPHNIENVVRTFFDFLVSKKSYFRHFKLVRPVN